VAGQQKGGVDPADGVQLASRVLTVAVHRGGLDAQFTRDLLGVQVRVNEAQTLALSRRQQFDRCGHRRSPDSNAGTLTLAGRV